MELEPHRQQVALALGALEKALARLVNALAHQPISIQLEGQEQAAAVRVACEAYSLIDYGMEDEVGTSIVCVGVIGCATDTLRRAEAVNEAKLKFKHVCVPLQQILVRVPVKGEDHQTRPIPLLRMILRSIQRSDLNLLAAYRKIPILDVTPASVTYTRANTRAVYRKTLEQVHDLLTSVEDPAVAADRERLMSLPRHEMHLAFVKQRYQNIRANVLYAGLDRRGRGRMQIAAELPLLYPIGRNKLRPEVRFITGEAPVVSEPRHVRQSELEPLPFLRTLPVYRYAPLSRAH